MKQSFQRGWIVEPGNLAKKTNYLVFAVVLTYLILQLMAEFIFGKEWIEKNIYLFLAFIQLFIILIPALLFVHTQKMSYTHVLRLKSISAPKILLIIPMAIISGFIASLLNSMVIFLLSRDFSASTGGIPIPATISEFYIQIIVVALIPSICEEIFFRGIICHAFEGMGVWKAIIISAFYFSLFHFDIRNLLGPFFLGVLIAWYCYRTDSILAGVIAHFTNNLLFVLINWFGRNSAQEPLHLTQGIVRELITYTVASGVVLVILINAFNAITKSKVLMSKEKKPKLQLSVITHWPMCFFYGVYIIITVLLLHNTR